MPTRKCCTLNRIKCNDPVSNTGGDNISILVSIDGGKETRYPDQGTFMDGVRECDEINVNIPFEFSETLYVVLFDDNNYVGGVTYTPSRLLPVTLMAGFNATYEFHMTNIRDC